MGASPVPVPPGLPPSLGAAVLASGGSRPRSGPVAPSPAGLRRPDLPRLFAPLVRAGQASCGLETLKGAPRAQSMCGVMLAEKG